MALALVSLLSAAACAQPPAGAFVQPHAVSESLGQRSAASLSLDSGATTINVHAADLADKLYRVATPDNSGVVPRGSITDDAGQLRLLPSNEPGNGSEVDLRLTTKVAWRLRIAGGATTESLDLRGVNLSDLQVTAGVGQLEIWLPVPTGPIAIQLSGGASGVRLHVPGGVPTQVTMAAGAGSVTIDGLVNSGIGAGASWTPDGWTNPQKHYDVQVLTGVGWLTLDRN